MLILLSHAIVKSLHLLSSMQLVIVSSDSKGPKCRCPSYIDFNRCRPREEMMSANDGVNERVLSLMP